MYMYVLLRVDSSLIHKFMIILVYLAVQVLFKKVRQCYQWMSSLFQQKHNYFKYWIATVLPVIPPPCPQIHLNYFLKCFHCLYGNQGKKSLEESKGKKNVFCLHLALQYLEDSSRNFEETCHTLLISAKAVVGVTLFNG